MPSGSKLFENLNFLIVTKFEQLESTKSIIDILKENSCQICSVYKCTNNTCPEGNLKTWFINEIAEGNIIHFIISEDIDFPFYRVASIDLLIPVVTPDWIHNCIETKKHARTSLFSPDPKHIFKKFQIYVSRHSFNASEYLFYTEIVHALGGTCVDFLSNKTTHLVTNDPRDPGIVAVLNFGKVDSMKFVYPTWIIECFKQIALASESIHKISPEDSSSSSKEKLNELWGQINMLDFKLTSNIWIQHSFIIGMDISLNRELYCTLIEFLQVNGGTVHRHLDESDIAKTTADCYIGKLMGSKEYEVAENKKLHLGNLIWIFYMWSLGQFSVPINKLLFSPFKRKLVETSQLITAYTNFFGQQRFYIQRLVNALGGFTTPDFSRRNTHLVCQFPFGKKFDTARKWQDRCVVTNHLWLEECYRQSTKLDSSELPFQEIPVHGGFRRTLGQMQWENTKPYNIGDFEKESSVDYFNTQKTPFISQSQEENTTIKNVKQLSPGQLPTNLETKEEHTITDKCEENEVNERKLDSIRHLNVESKSCYVRTSLQSDKLEQEQKDTERVLHCKEVNRQYIDISEQKDKCNLSNVQETFSEVRKHEERQSSDSRCTEPDHVLDLEKNHKRRNRAKTSYKKDLKRSQEEAKAVFISRDVENQIIRGDSIKNDGQKEGIYEEFEEIPAPTLEKLQEDKLPIRREHHIKLSSGKLESFDARQNGQGQQSEEKPVTGVQDQNYERNEQLYMTLPVPSKSPLEPLVVAKPSDHGVSQPGTGAIDSLQFTSPVSGNHKEVSLQTPPSELTQESIDPLPSIQGSRRAAKDKAVRKLHEDIESLNEFQRHSKRKKTENLLPDEIALLEKNKTLEIQAKEILLDLQVGENEHIGIHTGSEHIQNRLPKKLYHINAVLTGLTDNIDDLDLTILRFLGITIHKEITSENFGKLDTIIAPKKLRTVKFLKGLSFQPLRYLLTPKFLKDILEMVHKRKKNNLSVDISSYFIPDTDCQRLLELTSLPDKVFKRAGVSRVNIVNDMPGGVDTISSILKAHGVAEVKSIQTTHMNRLSIQDFLLNNTNLKYGMNSSWEYIFLINKPSQVRILKKLIKRDNNSAIAVTWDWFVTCIFQLEVDVNSTNHVIYRANGHQG